MIKMKALRSFGVRNANEGHISRGREFTAASEQRARDLEELELAYRLVETRIAQPEVRNEMVMPRLNEAAEAGPLDSRGGTIGAEAPAPSLPQDPPRRRRRSKRSEDADLL